MSSRNVFLSPEERRAALVLSRSLLQVQAMVDAGERSKEVILAFLGREIGREPLVRVDYIEALDGDNLRPVEAIEGKILLAVAAYVGKTRLIDNVLVGAVAGPSVV